MRRQVDSVGLELVQGDITKQETDAVVNAANEGLRGGGGVDGAIHRAGGPEIMRECRAIGRCPTGQAVLTTGGNLPARYVIHTVGPVWKGGDGGEPGLLASCYRNSLVLAGEKGIASVAFPSISTGVYGYPVRPAAEVALKTVIDSCKSLDGLELVRFVLFDAGTFDAYRKVLEAMEA